MASRHHDRPEHLLQVRPSLEPSERLEELLELAVRMKTGPARLAQMPTPGRTLACLLGGPSTRTRVSAASRALSGLRRAADDAAARRLPARPAASRCSDAAQVLSAYVDAPIAVGRVTQANLEELDERRASRSSTPDRRAPVRARRWPIC